MSTITTQEWNAEIVTRFPSIRDLFVTDRISICQLDRDFLDITPEDCDGTALSGWSSTDRIVLWSPDHKQLAAVRSGEFSHEDGSSSQGVTVGDTVARVLDVGQTIGYITRWEYDSGAAHVGTSETASLTIHRVGKLDLAAWRNERREQVKRAADAILGNEGGESAGRSWGHRAGRPLQGMDALVEEIRLRMPDADAPMMRLVCHADPGAFLKGIPSYPIAEPPVGAPEDAVDVDELYLEELRAAGRIDPSGMSYETAREELAKYRAAVGRITA